MGRPPYPLRFSPPPRATLFQVQIGEVNEIFRDLAVLVSDQGALVDTIDSNVTRAAGEVQSANTELAAAEKQQARRVPFFCVCRNSSGGLSFKIYIYISAPFDFVIGTVGRAAPVF